MKYLVFQSLKGKLSNWNPRLPPPVRSSPISGFQSLKGKLSNWNTGIRGYPHD